MANSQSKEIRRIGQNRKTGSMAKKRRDYTEVDALTEVNETYGSLEALVHYIFMEEPDVIDVGMDIEKKAKKLSLSKACASYLFHMSQDFHKLIYRPEVYANWDLREHLSIVGDISTGTVAKGIKPTASEVIKAGQYLREFVGDSTKRDQQDIGGGVIINIGEVNYNQEQDSRDAEKRARTLDVRANQTKIPSGHENGHARAQQDQDDDVFDLQQFTPPRPGSPSRNASQKKKPSHTKKISNNDPANPDSSGDGDDEQRARSESSYFELEPRDDSWDSEDFDSGE